MKIGILLFDGVTQLDAMGPLQVLSRLPDAEVLTLAKGGGAVSTDCPVQLMPTHSLEEAPALDMICVPGGFGVQDVLQDGDLMGFVREAGGAATYVTSVCTGALVIGAAGLLAGKKATTHWAYTELLAELGAQHVDARVVQDGNVFTGGGVTAGIDFALTIAAALKGPAVAQALQLGFEYNPEPPFNAGHPDTAPAEVTESLRARYAPLHANLREGFRVARESLEL